MLKGEETEDESIKRRSRTGRNLFLRSEEDNGEGEGGVEEGVDDFDEILKTGVKINQYRLLELIGKGRHGR